MTFSKIKKACKILFFGAYTFRSVASSNLFNPSFYISHNKLTRIPKRFALFHYLFIGYRKRFAPSVYLVPDFYYSQIQFKESDRVEPIYHYITKGWKKCINPHPLFETELVIKSYLLHKKSSSNPLSFYLEHWHLLEASPSRYFDIDYYQNRYQNKIVKGSSPWLHFITTGEGEGLCPHRLLERWFELCQFNDQSIRFAENNEGVLMHSVATGVHENLSQNIVLDTVYLADQVGCDDIYEIDFYQQVKTYLDSENNRPCRWFDPSFYRQRYLDEHQDPLDHYLSEGVWQGFIPNRDVEALKDKPLISILVPVFNVKAHFLNRCIRSVLFQSYPRWELCIVDDASTKPQIELLKRWQQLDKRIKVKILQSNKGISGATNEAAQMATGEFVAFVDNDDELQPEALYHMVYKINDVGADLLYSDEELIDHNGRLVHIFRKPGFNRELLYSHNYITHFVLTKRSLFSQVSGLDSSKDGAQDFDFLLKATEIAQKVDHVPLSLYRWRATETSTTINHNSKSYADEAGKKALDDALKRMNLKGDVERAEWKFYYKVIRKIEDSQSVTIVCDCREKSPSEELLTQLAGPHGCQVIEVTLLVTELLSQCPEQIRMVSVDKNKKDGLLFNDIVNSIDGRHILFIHGDFLPQNDLWIQGLIQYSQDPLIGMVGGRVSPLDQERYRVGRMPDIYMTDAKYYAEFLQMCSVHMNGLQWSQEVQFVNPKYFMVKKELWKKYDGIEPQYCTFDYAGMDLALKMAADGYTNMYCADAVVGEGSDCIDRDIELFEDDKVLFKKNKLCNKKGLTSRYYNVALLEDESRNLDDFYRWYC